MYCFYKKTIKWLCEFFLNEKLEMIFCKGINDKREAVDSKSTEKMCRSHKLLFEFIVVMNNEILDEKKCEEILNLYEMKKETFNDLVEFFNFCLKDNLFIEK